jgi:hypothetical protein
MTPVASQIKNKNNVINHMVILLVKPLYSYTQAKIPHGVNGD